VSDKVADIREARIKKTKELYASGPAQCLACAHEWIASVPIGISWLECPECELVRGVLKGPFCRVDEDHFTCVCGSQLFHIAKSGVYCPNCGRSHEYWNTR